jgi:hypothetical protein
MINNPERIDAALEKFQALFVGSADSHTVHDPESGYRTFHTPAGPAQYRAHLMGETRLTLKPGGPDGKYWWAASDHDKGNGDHRFTTAEFDGLLDEFKRVRQKQEIPIFCQPSKSNGLHSYVFFEEPQTKSDVRSMYQMWTAHVGYRDLIFPVEVQTGKLEKGINLPFFGAFKTDDSLNRLEEWLDAVKRLTVTPLLLNNAKHFTSPLGAPSSSASGSSGASGTAIPRGAPLRLSPGIDFEAELTKAGITFIKDPRADGETWFHYHGLPGKNGEPQPCLIAGRVHDNNAHNPRDSSFVIKSNGEFYATCLNTECRNAERKTRIALDRAGLTYVLQGGSWENPASPAPSNYPTPQSPRRIVWKRGDTFKIEQWTWIWDKVIPLAELGYLFGLQNAGKTPLVVDLASRISSGLPLPDGSANSFGPRGILWLSAEDDWARTTMPRVIAANGTPANFHVCPSSVSTATDGSELELAIAFDRDIHAIRQGLENWNETDGPFPLLLVVDPVTGYLGAGIEINKDEKVKPVLNSLADLARDFKITVLILGHFNKREGVSNHQAKVMGCASFNSVPRFGYYLLPDPDASDPYGKQLVPAREINSWKGLKLRTTSQPLDVRHLAVVDGEGNKVEVIKEVIRVEWLGAATGSADDAGSPSSRSERVASGKFAETLREFLMAGEKSSEECTAHLESVGLVARDAEHKKHLLFSIRCKANVESKRSTTSKGVWIWRLRSDAVQFKLEEKLEEPQF